MLFRKKKTVPLKDHKRVVSQLRSEIVRKDRIIQELKAKNEIVLNSSLKQAKKNSEILQIVKELRNKMKDKKIF